MDAARTLLLIEDEANLRAAVAQVLARSGYTVHAAASGADALRLGETYPEIALIVTDIRLPDMYGRRLAQRLEETRDPSALPRGVVYVSGNPTEVADGGGLAAHERFLAKPFDLDDLLATVAELLGTRRAR